MKVPEKPWNGVYGSLFRYTFPMNALEEIAAQAAKHKRKIVLPEGDDARVVVAAGRVVERGLASVAVVGDGDAVAALAAAEGVDLAGVEVIDPRRNAQAEKHAEVLLRARGAKGMTREQAQAEIRRPLTLAVCMVACGDADGCVAGAANTTSDVVRAALQIVGVKSGDGLGAESDAGSGAESGAENNLVSSFFVMLHDLPHQAIHGPAIFADCALVIDPDAAQLARIAMDSADSAVALVNMQPRVALLSFSTAGSASHPLVTKVREAGEIIARQRPDIELLPEVQFDAAVIPEILRRKAPAIKTETPANVFIFPDLQSANIGYKIAERIGGATAVGPILQGLKRPVNDLSRGCGVDDIVALVAVTAVQAHATQAQATP